MAILESLGISLPLLVAQLANVAVLFVLMWLFAYKPLMKMMDERARKVKESIDQTETVRQQAEAAEAEVQQRLTEAARQGQETIARAVKTGEELRREAQEQARRDAETLIARAKAEIARERDDAVDSLRREFADVTISAAEKVIERSLDKKAHREVIDRVLAESENLKKGQG